MKYLFAVASRIVQEEAARQARTREQGKCPVCGNNMLQAQTICDSCRTKELEVLRRIS